MGREYQGYGEEYNVKKRKKGRHYHLPCDIKAVGKKKSGEERKGELKIRGRKKKILRNGGGKNIKVLDDKWRM